jgi:hypothetical protein
MIKFVEINSNHFVNADRIAEVRFRRNETNLATGEEATVIMVDGETVRAPLLWRQDVEALDALYIPAAPGWVVVTTFPPSEGKDEWTTNEQPVVAWRVNRGAAEYTLRPITLFEGEATTDSHGLHERELDLRSVYFTAVRAPSGQVSIVGDYEFDDASRWLDHCKSELADAMEGRRAKAEAATKSKKPAPVGSPAR